MAASFEFDVFLSHASVDKPAVRELAERLKADGLRVWLDEWVIQPGDSILLGEDGPLYLSGDIEIVDYEHNLISRETRVALCRCGASQDKPFCDGSHTQAGFKDAGALSEDAKIGPPEGIGKIRIRLRPNGPLLFEGDLEIRGKDQNVEAGRGAFCRCGASDRKPLCDGTHNKIEFQAD